MFDLDIKVSSNEYFDLIRKLECLTSENEHLKGLNKNQMNTIIDMRNEITDLKKQVGDLCELVGKAKKETKDYEAMQNELRSLQDENAARIEAYEKLDKRYEKLLREYFKSMGENAACIVENYRLRRRLDNGCNTCPDMENTKKKNDELRKEVEDLKGTISRMHGGCQRAIELRRLLDELFEIKPNELVYDDEIRQRMKDLRAGAKDLQEQNQILKDKLNCVNASEAVLKDADAKIQSANDKAANAKKEAKYSKETAERYREENFVLHRQIDQFKKLNDELIKELARQRNAELILKFDRKGED